MTTAAPSYTQILSPHVSRIGGAPALRLPSRRRVIVIHTTQGHEISRSARNSAAWFKNPLSKASAHFVIDADEIIQCVPIDQIAWHAGKANGFSIGLEIVGDARQALQQWIDPYSVATLKRTAALAADLCIRDSIEVRKLTRDELAAHGAGDPEAPTGFVGHDDVSAVLGGTHYDPGPNFPWLDFMYAIEGYRQIALGLAPVQGAL